MAYFGRNHKTFAGNLFDPLGIIPGKRGFLGLGGDKKSEDAPSTPASPSVKSEDRDEDPDRLKRIGRAQLITTSSRGILSDAETSNKKLFGVQ